MLLPTSSQTVCPLSFVVFLPNLLFLQNRFAMPIVWDRVYSGCGIQRVMGQLLRGERHGREASKRGQETDFALCFVVLCDLLVVGDARP